MGKKLGFGLMRLPLTDPNEPGSLDMTKLFSMVDTFLEWGFTYFDTAWMYCGGKSEAAVKEALTDRHPRESFTVTSKLPSGSLKSKDDRDGIFFEQLRRTGLSYFDYYLLHGVSSRNLPAFEEFDCFNWILEKKSQGLVKNIGFSFHDTAEVLDDILTKYPQFDVVQLQINYLDWDDPKVQSRACYEVARKHGKPIIIMEPVKGGALADVPESVSEMFLNQDPRYSAASWAIRFAAGLPGVMMVLSGMSTMEQVLDNTGFMSDFQALTDDQIDTVHFAAEVIRKKLTIPCTGCAYCVDGCPKGIPIPQYFKLYNQAENGEDGKAQYEILSKEYPKASECIVCGACESICPQHLRIRTYLRKVSEKFE